MHHARFDPYTARAARRRRSPALRRRRARRRAPPAWRGHAPGRSALRRARAGVHRRAAAWRSASGWDAAPPIRRRWAGATSSCPHWKPPATPGPCSTSAWRGAANIPRRRRRRAPHSGGPGAPRAALVSTRRPWRASLAYSHDLLGATGTGTALWADYVYAQVGYHWLEQFDAHARRRLLPQRRRRQSAVRLRRLHRRRARRLARRRLLPHRRLLHASLAGDRSRRGSAGRRWRSSPTSPATSSASASWRSSAPTRDPLGERCIAERAWHCAGCAECCAAAKSRSSPTAVGVLGVACRAHLRSSRAYKASAVIRARRGAAGQGVRRADGRGAAGRAAQVAAPGGDGAADRHAGGAGARPRSAARSSADDVVDAMRTRMDVKLEGEDTFLFTYVDRNPRARQAVVEPRGRSCSCSTRWSGAREVATATGGAAQPRSARCSRSWTPPKRRCATSSSSTTARCPSSRRATCARSTRPRWS